MDRIFFRKSEIIHHFCLQDKEIYLIGHSSGGGLAIRFSASAYGNLIKGVILLSPTIPTAPSMRKNAGGWAKISFWKIILLSILNNFGITYFNHTKVIKFNRPKEYCNGTETLSYSFNLNSFYHPRLPYTKDISSIKNRSIVIAGSLDEANNPFYHPLVMQDPQSESICILSGIHHLEITQNQLVFNSIINWINTGLKI